MKNKINIKSILSSAKMIVLAVVLALGLSYASATWVAPTSAPTGGNAEAPINVGGTNQAKGGPAVSSLLDVNGLFTAQNILSFNDITDNNLSQAQNPSLTYDNGLIGVCANTSGKLVACERNAGGSNPPSSGYVECRTDWAGACRVNGDPAKYIALGGGAGGVWHIVPGQQYTVGGVANQDVIPASVTQVKIQVWGGGGGGGSTVFSSCYPGYTGGAGGGGGGGGGGFSSGNYNLSGVTDLEIHPASSSASGTSCQDDAQDGDFSRVKIIGGGYTSANWPMAMGGLKGRGSIISGVTFGGAGGGASGGNEFNINGSSGANGITTGPATQNGGAGGLSGNPSGFGTGGYGSCSAYGCNPADGGVGRVKISW